MTDSPVTRWELADHRGYAARFAALIEAGEDIEGEARLADVLAPRNARILDAGAGMGRVSAALRARGHQVTAVEKDPALVADARARYPGLPVVESDILGLSTGVFAEAGVPEEYDLVVMVGNVMILLAEHTERRVLSTLAGLLAPAGRLLVGFRTTAGPRNSRDYPWPEFAEDAEAAGLRLQQRFGTYDLAPAADDYVVAVLSSF